MAHVRHLESASSTKLVFESPEYESRQRILERHYFSCYTAQVNIRAREEVKQMEL